MIESYGSFFGCSLTQQDAISALKHDGRERVAFQEMVFLDMLYHEFYDKCHDIIKYAFKTKGEKYPQLQYGHYKEFRLLYQVGGNISVSHNGKLYCDSSDVDITCIHVVSEIEDEDLFIMIDLSEGRYSIKISDDLPKHPTVSLMEFKECSLTELSNSEYVDVPIFGDSTEVPTTRQTADLDDKKKDLYRSKILSYISGAFKGQLGKSPQDLMIFCMKVIDKRYMDISLTQVKTLSECFPDQELAKIINEDWPLYAKNKL